MIQEEITNCFHSQWDSDRLRRAEPGAEAEVEPEAGADSDIGGDIQLRDGEPSEGRDQEDQSSASGVRPGRRRQRLLLVPEPAVAIPAPPAADGAGQPRSGAAPAAASAAATAAGTASGRRGMCINRVFEQ